MTVATRPVVDADTDVPLLLIYPPPFGCNLLASLPLLPWLWALLGVSWPRQSPHLYLAGVELLLSAPAVAICCKIALVDPFSCLHPIPSAGHTSQHRQQYVARKRALLFCNTVTNPRHAHRVWATQRSRQSIIFFPSNSYRSAIAHRSLPSAQLPNGNQNLSPAGEESFSSN